MKSNHAILLETPFATSFLHLSKSQVQTCGLDRIRREKQVGIGSGKWRRANQKFSQSTLRSNHWPTRSGKDRAPEDEHKWGAISTLLSTPSRKRVATTLPFPACRMYAQLPCYFPQAWKSLYANRKSLSRALYNCALYAFCFSGNFARLRMHRMRMLGQNQTDQTDRNDLTADRSDPSDGPVAGGRGPIDYRLMSHTSVSREASRQLMPGSSGTSKVRTMVPYL